MIGIGCDHTAIQLKNIIIQHLQDKGYKVKDFGAFTAERTHYPIYAGLVAKSITTGECDKGILICGSGIGIGIAANKVKGIRCVTCSESYSAMMSRQHNNTNVLSFGARVVGEDVAKQIVDVWLETQYEGGRHQVRVDMITEMENWE
ncbi:MAG: ribose 5-phosphate isomerase B [Oscillospiraceae bacterium]